LQADVAALIAAEDRSDRSTGTVPM